MKEDQSTGVQAKTMKSAISALAMVIILLFGFAAPSQATVITLGSAVSGTGDITTSSFGTNAPLSNSASCTPTPLAICNLEFATLMISGAPNSSANGTYNPLDLIEGYSATTDTLTIYGAIGGCSNCSNLPGLTTAQTLITIVFSSNLTGDATGSSFSLNAFPLVTSITINATLLSDLGASGSYVLTALTANGNPVGDIPNYSSTTASLVLTSAVAEPGTLTLIALGLAIFAFVLSKRGSSKGLRKPKPSAS